MDSTTIRLNKTSLEVIGQKPGALRRYLVLLRSIFHIPGDLAIIRLNKEKTGGRIYARTGIAFGKPGALVANVNGVSLHDSGFILCGSHICSFPADLRMLLDVTLCQAYTHQMVTKNKLTGLLNLHGLSLCVNQFMEKARKGDVPVCMLFVDGDHLKQINDTLGHEKGDKIIKQIGEVIKKASRKHDLAIHRSGDEFYLLLYDATQEQGFSVGQRILQSLAEESMPNGQILTACIGVSQPGYNLDLLIMESEKAMYKAKNQGRAQVCAFQE